MSDPSPSQWAVFANLQKSFEPTDTDECLGREEALSEMIEDIAAESGISDQCMRKRFTTLSRNRGNKYRYRRQLERDQNLPSYRHVGRFVGPSALRPPTPDIADDLAWRDLVTMVANAVTPAEFLLLWEIAEGGSYENAANARDVTVASLKARIFRIRRHVRESSVGSALREALEYGYPGATEQKIHLSRRR